MSLVGQLMDAIRPKNSIENPRIGLNDPRAWDELFGINLSETGIRVTPKTAIGYAPLWRGINLISGTVAKLPFRVYRQTDETHIEKDRKHPAYYLLHWKANDGMTAGVFKQTLTYHALFRGNGYAAIFRDSKTGEPVELLPLSPTATTPVQENGRIVYVSKAGGETRKLAARDVLHIRGLSYDGLVGHDVITVMADTLGVGIAARKFGSKFFANGANAGGVLMLPRGMTDQAQNRLRKDWKTFQEGLDNSFRTAVLEDGAKWQPTTINPEQSQLMALRQFEVREVANVLGLPPHKLGDDSRLAYNSLEQENKAVLEDCYDRWLLAWEEECDDKLLTDEERGFVEFRGRRTWRRFGNFCQFDRSALQLPDDKTRAEIDDKRVNTGIETLNEVRSRNNLPPVDPEIGDVIRIPTTVTLGVPEDEAAEAEPDTELGNTPEPEPAASNLAPSVPMVDRAAVNSVLKSIVADRIESLEMVEREEVCQAANRGGDYVKQIDKWLKSHERRLNIALKAVWNAISDVNGGEIPRNSRENAAAEYIKTIREHALKAAEVPASKLAESVESTMSGDAIAQSRQQWIEEIFRCP